MPEGDSLVRMRRRLEPDLVGAVVTSADLRTPQAAAALPAGSVITSVHTHGKNLFCHCDTPMGFRAVQWHLRMDGRVTAHPAGTPLPAPEHRVRMVLDVQGPGREPRRIIGVALGELRVLNRVAYQHFRRDLGPDILLPGTDLLALAAQIEATPQRSIGEALLDQRLVAGIGTEYRAEVCFLAGVDPRAPVGALQRYPGLVAQLLQRTQASMRDNLARPVRTFTGTTRGSRTFVFGRGGQPCLRCGTRIVRELHGTRAGQERFVWVCPRCQPPLVARGLC